MVIELCVHGILMINTYLSLNQLYLARLFGKHGADM